MMVEKDNPFAAYPDQAALADSALTALSVALAEFGTAVAIGGPDFDFDAEYRTWLGELRETLFPNSLVVAVEGFPIREQRLGGRILGMKVVALLRNREGVARKLRVEGRWRMAP